MLKKEYKICYIANSTVPSQTANSFQVMKMCDGFAGLGMDVILLLPKNENIKSFYILKDFYSLSNNFDIEYLMRLKTDRLSNFSYALSVLIYVLRKLGKKVIYYTRNELIALWLARLGFPVIYETHQFNYGNKSIDSKIQKRVLKLSSLPALLFIVSISNMLKMKWLQVGVPEEKIFVLHDAVDLERFFNLPEKETLRKEIGLPIEKFIVTYCGKISKDRGIEILLETALRLKDVYFLIIGGREKEIINEFKEYVIKRKIENVLFTGFVENKIVPKYLKASDVLVMLHTDACLIKDVTSPLKLFEYLAAGKPIIACDLPAIKEILKDEENALLIKPSVSDLIKGIKRIRQDNKLIRKIEENNFQLAQKYTWKNRCEKIIDLISRYQ